MKSNILFGTDPEFALKTVADNRIVSAIPVLNRSKENKIDLGDEHKIYFDNVLLEANIPPADSKDDLKNKLRALYAKSQELLKNYKLAAVASHTFGEDECSHPEAQRFGCDPELDVDAGMPAYPPSGGHTFRSAGGHIHIGNFVRDTIEEKINLVYLMDLFVGVPAVLLDNDPTSLERKRLYGKAGRFRDCEYGLEYRTLSNFWLSSPELTDIIYDLTNLAAETDIEGNALKVLKKFKRATVVNTINNLDKKSAYKIVNKLPISDEMKERIFKLSQTEYSDDIFKNWL